METVQWVNNAYAMQTWEPGFDPWVYLKKGVDNLPVASALGVERKSKMCTKLGTEASIRI